MKIKPSINTKGRYKLNYRGTKCLNCEHPLDISDKYCPSCSQANSIKKLTLKDFIDEFFSNIISYDSRLFKTLFALLIRPGRITRDYIFGKRISYTNPFRFLLSLGIIYFLLLGLSGNLDQLNRYGKSGVTAGNLWDLSESVTEHLNLETHEDAKDLGQILDSLNISDNIISTLKEKERLKDSLIMANPKNYLDSIKGETFIKKHLQKQNFFYTLIQKGDIYFFEEVVEKYEITDNVENKSAFNIAQSALKVKRQPGAFLNAIISKLPFTTFFFLPVFAMFISLAYIRKKYTYTDHLIFSFHNQSLLFILLIVSYLIDTIFEINSSGIFLLIFALYLYKAMRNFYDQGRFKTIVKYIFLNTIFVILACVGIVLLLAGSAITY